MDMRKGKLRGDREYAASEVGRLRSIVSKLERLDDATDYRAVQELMDEASAIVDDFPPCGEDVSCGCMAVAAELSQNERAVIACAMRVAFKDDPAAAKIVGKLERCGPMIERCAQHDDDKIEALMLAAANVFCVAARRALADVAEAELTALLAAYNDMIEPCPDGCAFDEDYPAQPCPVCSRIQTPEEYDEAHKAHKCEPNPVECVRCHGDGSGTGRGK